MTKGEIFWMNAKRAKRFQGLSWNDIAERTGYSLSRIETMIYRKTLPRLDVAVAIAKVLEVDVDLLLMEDRVIPVVMAQDFSEAEIKMIQLLRVGDASDQAHKHKMLSTLLTAYNERLVRNKKLTDEEIMRFPPIAEMFRMAREDGVPLAMFVEEIKKSREKAKEEKKS